MRSLSMHRTWLGSFVLILVIIASILPVQAQESSADVSTYQSNPARTGDVAGPGPDLTDEISERWSLEIAVPDDLPFGAPNAQSGVAIVDGVAYFGGVDGAVRAVDAATGAIIWESGAGLPKIGVPAVASGLLFILDLENTLHAVATADGAERWSANLGEVISQAQNGSYPTTPSPAVVDGVVYIGGLDGAVHAFDAETGEERWVNALEANIYRSVAVDDGRVFAAAAWPQKIIRAIDAETGATLWDQSNDNQSSADGLIAANGLLHVQHFWGAATYDAATGELVWERFADAYSQEFTPVLIGDTFVLGSGKTLYAVDAATGEPVWALELSGMYIITNPLVVADGVIYFKHANSFHAINGATGELLGEFSIGYRHFGWHPVTPWNGLLIGRADTGVFVAYGGPSEADLAETAEAEAAAETATAEAMQTATAEAEIGATATAEAAITATAVAEIREAERAYEAQWEGWAQMVGESMAASPDFPASFSLGSPEIDISDEEGQPHVAALFEVEISDNSQAMVAVGIFASEEAAAAEYAAAVDGSIRSGFQQESIDGLGDNAACFTMVNDGETMAGCFILRGDTMLVVQAMIEADAREAALLNATDLLRLIDAAVAATPRP